MPPLEHFFVRALDDRYRAWLTPAGRMLLWATVAAATLLLGGIVASLVYVVAFLLALFTVAIVMGALFRPSIVVQRVLPPPLSAGDVLRYKVKVRNRGRTARLVDICERDLPAALRPFEAERPIGVLRPGEEREITLGLACLRRGAYDLPALQAASAFPSGFVKWGRRVRAPDRLLVYPTLTHLEGFEVPHARNYQPGGIAVASQVGDSSELFGTREFKDGDRVRDIHWASSARTGRLVVKEFQEEYFVRLALVIDTAVANDAQEARFERSLSIAAGIADVLAKKEYVIDIFAAGRDVHRFRAGRALAHVEHILELLACVEADDRLEIAALEAELLPEAGKLSAVVLVMTTWDRSRADVVAKLKAHGIAVRVILVGPHASPAELADDEVVVTT